MAEIVTKDKFKNEIRPEIKAKGSTIALCHGVFDLVHPGHINHFKEAREMADVLVVSITAAEFVRKGPGRPYFDDETRLSFLSVIDYIDYVMLSEGFTVDDIIEAVEPDIYVKGSEYADEDADLTGKIREERELVESHGGRIAYTGGAVYSSTKLINTAMSGLNPSVRHFMERFSSEHDMEEIKAYAEKAKSLKVLVVGDLIIDRYTYCQVHGLISKDTVFSSRFQRDEYYLGGSMAVARHLSSFAGDVSIICAYGGEEDIREKIDNGVADNVNTILLKSKERPTIIKHKYLMQNSRREEYKKVFAIHNIPESISYEESLMANFHSKLEEILEDFDAVFLCDFGHGLLDKKAMDIIQEKAKYLILNVQTNSSNHGMNPINKYHRADVFSLDQGELALAYPAYIGKEDAALLALKKDLGGCGFLTRGADGAKYVYNDSIENAPAFTLKVKDTVGAGDAFYSLAGVFAAARAPIDMCLFAGNIGGALGANIVGNKESVESVNFLKYASTLMNV